MQPTLLELPFGIVFDLSFWANLLNLPSYEFTKAVFAIGGWVALALVFFFMGAQLWIDIRQDKAGANWKWVLLAIDIPPEEVQSPKAVEQIFAHLSGALSNPNFGEKYWKGVKQKWFSLEVISIEGYIQFLVRTESEFRDLVEASIYAQHPMAEITEVEDYTGIMPTKYPNDSMEMFGIEFGLANKDAYPIRTYEEFEHSITKDFQFNDPMGSILENFARIGTGENFWMQIIIEPTSDSWKKAGIDLVKEIVTQKKPVHGDFFLVALLKGIVTEFLAALSPSPEGEKKKTEEKPAGKVSDLTPGLKNTVNAIEDKISKVGFKAKIRALYIAKKEVFNPSKCVKGFIGSMNQFNFSGRNALIPKIATEAHYAFAKIRTSESKTKMATAYKKRKIKIGKTPYILNIEELATIWHFPMPLVKTPLLQKTASKRAEPPINLPIESAFPELEKPEETPKLPPPEELYG